MYRQLAYLNPTWGYLILIHAGMDNLWYNFDLFMSPYLDDGALVRWYTSRPMFILISLLGRPPSRQAKRSTSSDSPGSPVIISNVRNASSRSTCCEVISLCYKSPHYFNSNSEVRIPLHIPLTPTHAPKFDHRYQTPGTNRMYRRDFPLLGNTSCWSGSS